MKFLILIHILSFLAYVFVWAYLYSRQRRDSSNRALRFFFFNQALWAFAELSLFMPITIGHELLVIKAMAITWIGSSFWFVNFIYKEFKRKVDWIYISCVVSGVIGIVLYYTTDWAIRGSLNTELGPIEIRGPYYLWFTAIPGLHGLVSIGLLLRKYLKSTTSVFKQGMLFLLIGSTLSLLFGMILGALVPAFASFAEFPSLGAFSTVILVPFIFRAMGMHGTIFIQIDEVAEELFEDVLDGIILLDREDRVSKINNAARQIFNLSKDNYIGKKASDLLPNFDAYSQNRKTEIVIERYDKLINLSLSLSQAAHDGIPMGKIVLVKNISYERQAVDVLRRSQQELEAEVDRRLNELKSIQHQETIGTIAGGIAHDFNNLLVAIIGFSTAARDDLAEAENPVSKDLDEVLAAARRAKEIVHHLLAFSRPQKAHREPIEINHFLNNTLSLVKSSLPANINLQQNLMNEKTWVMGDPSQLHQVVMNLCTNAFQSMKDNGGELRASILLINTPLPIKATSSSVEKTSFIRITISDTGSGIPAESLNKIFDPFYTTRDSSESSGLGLATALRIVKEHSGSLTVESQENIGTNFFLSLPIIDNTIINKDDPTQKILTGGEHVMWIEEKLPIKIGRRLLTSLGYRITGFTDPHEAINAFRKTPSTFDVIVCKQTMRDMTGLKIAKELFSERPNVPIIFISDSFSPTEKTIAKNEGIKGFLVAPLSKKQLGTTIRKALK